MQARLFCWRYFLSIPEISKYLSEKSFSIWLRTSEICIDPASSSERREQADRLRSQLEGLARSARQTGRIAGTGEPAPRSPSARAVHPFDAAIRPKRPPTPEPATRVMSDYDILSKAEALAEKQGYPRTKTPLLVLGFYWLLIGLFSAFMISALEPAAEWTVLPAGIISGVTAIIVGWFNNRRHSKCVSQHVASMRAQNRSS